MLKAVLIVGPNTSIPQYLFDLFNQKDHLMIGDGINPVNSGDFISLESEVDEQTIINIWGHGNVVLGRHCIQMFEDEVVEGNLIPFLTEDLFKEISMMNSEVAHNIHLYSCFAGAAASDVRFLPSGSTLIAHGNKESPTMSFINAIMIKEITEKSYDLNSYIAILEYMPQESLQDCSFSIHTSGKRNVFTHMIRSQEMARKLSKKDDIDKLYKYHKKQLVEKYNDFFKLDSTALLDLPNVTDEDVKRQILYNLYVELVYFEGTDTKKVMSLIVGKKELFNGKRYQENSIEYEIYAVIATQSYLLEDILKRRLNISNIQDILMINAIKRNKIACVSKLLDAGFSANIQDEYGNTCFHYALYCNNIEIVNLLIRYDADLNQQDARGDTPLDIAFLMRNPEVVYIILDEKLSRETSSIRKNPLTYAVEKRDIEILNKMLSVGINPDTPDINGDTPLYLAVKNGDLDIINLLLGYDSDINKPHKQNGISPLMLASKSPNRAVAFLFLEKMRMQDRGNEYEKNPLIYIAKSGRDRDMRFFIKSGINPNILDSEGYSPIYYAVSSRDYMMIDALIDHSNINSLYFSKEKKEELPLLYYAIMNQDSRTVELLIERGANAKHVCNMLNSLLHIAALMKNDKIVCDLIRHGVDINGENDYGYTPLHNAIIWNNVKIVNTLLELGADLNKKTNNGSTPLDLALYNKNYDIAYLLIKKEQLITNKYQAEQTTPLTFAVISGNLNQAKLLLEIHSDPNAIDPRGTTALHEAVKSNNLQITKLLLYAGAKTNQKDSNGKTVMDFIDENTKAEIFEVLNLEYKNQNQWSTKVKQSKSEKKEKIHRDGWKN